MTPLKLYGNAERCWWCARKTQSSGHPVHIRFRKDDYSLVVCSSACETAVMKAYRHIQKFGPLFLIGMAAGLSLIVMGGPRLSAAGLLLAGLTLVVAPFATPQTTQTLGLKKSMSIARLAGIGLSIGAGAILAVTSE